ncbi:unnamed protein product, partial [Symbiodinium necroappetens]
LASSRLQDMELGYAKHSAGSKQKHQNRQARTGFCSGAFVLDLLANRHLERLDKILVMPSEHHLISWGRETRALLLTGALSAENRADAPRKLGQAEMEELPPLKRPRVAGGFEVLPDGVLGTIVGFLLPIAHKDDQYAQYHRMAARMYDALAYNHEAMPLARRARAAGLLPAPPLRPSLGELALDCRCPQYELRSLEITVERMPPAQGR